MATKAEPGKARVREALARNPEFETRLADLWRRMPLEFKMQAVHIYADSILEAVPRDLAYRIFECGWSWLETEIHSFEARKVIVEERRDLTEAKNLMMLVRRKLKEMKEEERNAGTNL